MTEKKWIWTNGNPVITAYWGGNEPGNYLGNENCAETNRMVGQSVRTPKPGEWNDANCATKMGPHQADWGLKAALNKNGQNLSEQWTKYNKT